MSSASNQEAGQHGPEPQAALAWSPPATLRTGLTHVFKRAANADRSAAVEFWRMCREGKHTGPTPGIEAIKQHVQANLVILPRQYALDFLIFCLRNPKPCPLLDVTDPGCPNPGLSGVGADVRTDVPKYRVWRNGRVESEPTDVTTEWAEMDSPVAFLLGCSFSFENALAEAGLVPRHCEQARNVPMYKTNVPNVRSGPFGGELVVSMRPYTRAGAQEAAAITGRFPGAHGNPVQCGDAQELGISSVEDPDYGDAVDVRPGEMPVFWACGVTPQTAVEQAALPLVITHAPGHMFVCDLLEDELRVGSEEPSDHLR